MSNAAQALWDRAETMPSAPALRQADRTWSYAQVRDRSAAFAKRLLDSGVGPGDRVVVVVPTVAEFVFAYYGILAAGAVAVTTNTLSTEREIEFFAADSGASLVVAWHEADGPARAAAATADVPCWTIDAETMSGGLDGDPVTVEPCRVDDAAVLLYTSGTTGRPKGALLTHGNLVAAARSLCEAFGLGAGERFGTALPLFHVFGQVAVLACALESGGTMSLLRPFTGAALLEMAAAHRLTILSGVPTMWTEMLYADTEVRHEDLADLRLACSGGASLPLAVADAFHERFGARVLDGYGLSETAAAATSSYPGVEPAEGSVGRALPGLSVRIRDDSGADLPSGQVGEVVVSGPVVMRGYWNNPAATADAVQDGWLLTGDLGRMDDEGRLWIVDRKKDMVIRGGYNVYPQEVEDVLYQHPDVREAAVVGVPDDRLGEEVAAVIVPKDGRELDLDALRPWIEQRLAAYKVPRLYRVVDELPKGATGKILKRSIDRADLTEQARRVRG